jgi:hypothetical protein
MGILGVGYRGREGAGCVGGWGGDIYKVWAHYIGLTYNIWRTVHEWVPKSRGLGLGLVWGWDLMTLSTRSMVGYLPSMLRGWLVVCGAEGTG